MNSGVYQILNTVSGKRYIGSSVDLYHRWNTHRARLRANLHDNRHLQNSYNKHGEECFCFSSLEEIESTELVRKEQCWIDSFDFGRLYNIRPLATSNLGYRHSEESKKRMSAARKGHPVSAETRKKLSEWHTGRKLSKETRRRISEAGKGRRHTEKAIQKMSVAHSGERNPMHGVNGKDSPRYGKSHTKEARRKISISASKMITFNGRTQSQQDWAAEIGITGAALSHRLKTGWSLDRALTAPKNEKKPASNSVFITLDGKTQNLTTWAMELGISRRALMDRLKTWSVEDALTVPGLGSGKRRPIKEDDLSLLWRANR